MHYFQFSSPISIVLHLFPPLNYTFPITLPSTQNKTKKISFICKTEAKRKRTSKGRPVQHLLINPVLMRVSEMEGSGWAKGKRKEEGYLQFLHIKVFLFLLPSLKRHMCHPNPTHSSSTMIFFLYECYNHHNWCWCWKKLVLIWWTTIFRQKYKREPWMKYNCLTKTHMVSNEQKSSAR